MVKIFDIKENDNTVSCKYTPEQTDKVGTVTVDKTTKEVVDIKYSDYEYGKKSYVAHVRAKIDELLTTGSAFPNEAIVTWY